MVAHVSKIKQRPTKKPEESDAVAEVKHRHGNSVASLKRAHANKSIIYLIMLNEKAPVYKLSHRKAPKTQQICPYRHARKTSGPFLSYYTGIDFSSRNNLANLGSFAKVSVALESIIS